MSADEQMRTLLNLAAELPDLGPGPAERLIAQGRRRRRRNRVLIAAATSVAVIAGAVGLPVLADKIGSHSVPITGPAIVTGRPLFFGAGPSAAQLAHFRWSGLPPSPLGPRSQPVLAWTGKELVELAGPSKSASLVGAAYDPATGRWHRIASPNGNVGVANAVTAWTGHQLFTANGQVGPCVPGRGPKILSLCLPFAGLYDPATNTWSTTKLPSQLRNMTLAAAVWTGRDIIVAGTDPNRGRLAAAAYDPASNHWRMITPRLPAGHPPRFAAMTVTPGRLTLWSLWDRATKTKDGGSIYSGVDVLALDATGRWTNVTGGWPQNHLVTSPVFTGSAILVSPAEIWCGGCSPPFAYTPGYLADPATLHRTEIPLGPLGDANPPFVWAGRAVIAVNLDATITGPGKHGLHIRPGDLAAWDAASGWHTLPAIPARPNISATPIWTGTALLALTDQGHLLSLHP